MPRAAAVALAALLLLATAGRAAHGQGSFQLCYERLKQLAVLMAVQGTKVEVVTDAPRERKYAIVLVSREKRSELSCSAKGDLLVEEE